MATSAQFDADFGGFISELLKVDVTLRKFEGTADKSSAKLERLANSMQGNKIAEQAAVAVAAIQKIDKGVAGLTDNELKRYGSAIDEATQKFERMGREVPPAMAQVKGALDEARAAAQSLTDVKPPGNLAGGLVDQTQSVAGGFGAMKTSAIGAIAGIASSLTTMGVTALKDFAAEALATGGKVADLAAKTGLTTTEVQTFGYVAEQSGSSMDAITGAVTKLSDNLAGGSDSTVAALKAAGLELESLQAMKPGEAFTAVAEAVAKIPDPMNQTNIAIDLLGKSGADILPAIKGGFTDAAAEAERLGLVINEDSIKALDDMGDAWDRMALRAKVAFANVFASLASAWPGFVKQVQTQADTVAKLAIQTTTGAMGAALGPFGGMAASLARSWAGPVNEGDLAILGAATAKGDIPAPGGAPAIAPPGRPPKVDKAAAREAAAALKAEAEAIAQMTGAKQIADAEKLAKRINSIGASNIPAQNVKALADQLMRAKAIAEDTGKDTGKIGAALNTLEIPSKRVAVNMLTVQGSISGAARTADTLSDRLRGSNSAMTGLINSTNPLSARLLELPKAVEGTTVKVTEAVDQVNEMDTAIRGAAQAFAVLAQASGGAMGNISQGIGTVFAAVDASKQAVGTIAGLFNGGKGFAKGSAGAKAMGAAGAGLAAWQTGSQFGAMAGSGGKGALAGAASGAAAGTMVMPGIGTAIGAGIGAIAGYFGGKKAEKERMQAMADSKKALLAMFESREDLIEQGKRIGMTESEINSKILNNTKDTKGYEAATKKLTEGLEKEQKQAAALAKDLGKVAAANGVLSGQQMKDVRGAAAAGGGPRTEAAQAFMTQQAESLMQGLQGALDSGAALSPALVTSIGESLPAAFAELQRSGLSTIDALKAMAPILESFQRNAVLAGAGSSPGFDALNAQLGILKDERLGPMVEQAGYASQAMAALNNTGWLTQQTFSGFAGTITDTFNAMVAGGASGESALAMMHQPLQNIWQLQKDFGYEVDASTQAMLDTAEAAGTVGDKWRPAGERMAESMDKVVERLDEMIALFSGDLVDGAREGASKAGGAITDAFAAIRPRIVIEYEYAEPAAPPSRPGTPPTTPAPPPGGTDAAKRATEGAGGPGDVYLDGDRVGYHVARRLDDVSARVT